MWDRAVLTGMGLYSVLCACIDWYRAVQCLICLYRLVLAIIVLYMPV